MRVKMRGRGRAGALAAAVIVAAGAWAAVGGGGPAGAATLPGGTWGLPQAMPGLAALNGAQVQGTNGNTLKAISCTSPGNCAAIGNYRAVSGTQPFTATETDGTWGNAQPVSGTPISSSNSSDPLNAVSCGAPGSCTAVGSHYNPSGNVGYLATEANGGAWTARTLPGTIGPDTVQTSLIRSVSCTGPGDCTVVGDYTATPPGGGGAFTLDESGGTWGTPQPVAGLPAGASSSSVTSSALFSVSCSAPGDCTAGGDYNTGTGNVPFVVSESGGTWGTPQAVPDFAALNSTSSGNTSGYVLSVSCPDTTDCAAVGYYAVTTGGTVSSAAFTADEAGGAWGPAKPLDIPSEVNGPTRITVGCRAAGNCVVAGSVFVAGSGTSAAEAFDAAETSSGGWGQGQALPGIPAGDQSGFHALSCVPEGDCTVLGGYAPAAAQGGQIFAATIGTDGSTGTVRPVQPAVSGTTPVTVGGIACPQDGYCTLIEDSGPVVQLVSEATAATVSLSASAPTVTYGDEQAETLTATVASPDGGTPTGKVTVSSGSATVCSITLTNGTGSCKLPATALPAGTDRLTATYSGDVSYAAAISTATITVAKATYSGTIRLTKMGLCLDDRGNSTGNGAVVQVWQCNGAASQQWQVFSDGTIRHNGLCLDARANGTANGTKVQLWACTLAANQKWDTRSWRIHYDNPAAVNKVLDDRGSGGNGTQQQIWTNTGGANQIWATT
jgi:hypothetical protein